MARKKPVISPFGQWAYPGEVTIIPSSDITMKGVNYPVLGIDNLGNQQMMMPGGEYTFPGDYVTEYPQMNKGGQMIKRKDGSYSKRGLWDNIRANKGSGKKPTKEMLEQERKIKAKMQNGGWLEQYQSGGLLSMGDYDLTTAPKRGDYLLPDINRPSYIDDAGNKRSEYKMGFNIHGKETLIPSVVNGRQLSEDEALDRYYKTGLHMGQFNTPEEADYASRLRTARYNMLEDPIRFQADQFQRGGVRPPIYTSNPRDPRLLRFNDSMDAYNFGENQYRIVKKIMNSARSPINADFRKNYTIQNTRDLPLVNDSRFGPNGFLMNPYQNYYESYRKKPLSLTEKFFGDDRQNYTININEDAIVPGKNINKTHIASNSENKGNDIYAWYARFKKPVVPVYYKKPTALRKVYKKPVSEPIYKKSEIIPEVVETPVAPIPVVEPPKPSLFVSNIDRDMYTPGGGMGREYNIGITLQDGSKKAFRTEKEYQDWKAANNLDISNAKVTEGKGYSYDYPENKKYGGWLDQYQDGSEVPSDIERMDAAVIKRDRSWLDKLKGYIHRGEKAIGLDPYNERPDDFMEQWARRINTATGGRDWYKQPNDASGAGGIGTAMMETVMAPFSAPQLASVYGATGKVQMPSEAMNIQNPVGSFLADAILDPTNLVGAGLTKTGQRIINYVPEQITKLAESQIKKSPKLAMSLQKGRPVSLDNVNTISGIRYGDVQPFPVSTNALSENAFFKQLEKGAESLNNSVSRRVADLESEEGFRRLVEQEKAYLFDNTDTDLSVIDRVAKLNAKARIEELKNIKNVNKEAAEYASTNFLGTGMPNTFVDNSYLYNNAYHQPASLYDHFVKSSGTLNLKKPTSNYSTAVPGEIGIGYNYTGDVPTEMHEIAHALQRGRKLSLDNGLTNIVPKKDLDPINQRQYKYFKKGSHGQEPTAFANELREAMFQKGFIPDYYTPINQQQVQDAYKYFKKNPMGIYDKNTGDFSSNTRIFDFMAPTKANSKLITDVLNRLPAVAPLGVGAAAASQLEQRYGGWLNNYQDGGENLPELNSKIDIANFYKNPLSEKYGIYQDPEDDTYKYYLKSGEESQILEYGPDLSNLDKQKLKEINARKGSLSEIQLSNIQPVSSVILPKQRERILRDKVYYEQDDLMAETANEFPISPVKTPSYSEILESDPEFKKVMTEKPKPVAPIKPKPVSATDPIVPITNAPRAITKPAVQKIVAKNNIVNLADFTITKSDLAYLNKVEEYCPGGNCLETTRNAYDMLAGRVQGIPTSSDIWSKDLNVHSKKGTPSANDIKQYPYFAGDSGSGTVDSWDIHGVIVQEGGKNLFNVNNPTPIDYKKIPVGAVIGWGPANAKDSSYSGRSKGYNKKFGMQPSHHSTMVVGYSEDGEPLVYDGYLKKYMTLTEAKTNIGSKLGYELENISAPKSVLNNTQDTLKNQGVLLNYIPPTNINPNKILSAANQPWAQIPEGSAKRAPRFNKQMMTEFNSALLNNKGELLKNLNISSEKYDELSKVALAISAQESEGGGALGFVDGSTVGMTQLNPDNIFKDDKLNKIASKPYMLNDGNNNILNTSLIQKSPSASAVATMIYLSKLDKDAQRYYTEGKTGKTRSFTKNSNIIKDAIRTNTAKYNADGFFVEEANKRIDLSPFEGGMLSSPDPVGAQKLINKTAGNDRYKVSVKNGNLVIDVKTKGNANLTVPEIIAYAWQSPNTLKLGDAQGDSIYSRRIKNYYDLLNNTTPTYKKEGGETGWLNKYK
jgi:hypothetical protein